MVSDKLSHYLQYCAKVMQTPVDEIRRNSWLFDEFLTETKLRRQIEPRIGRDAFRYFDLLSTVFSLKYEVSPSQ